MAQKRPFHVVLTVTEQTEEWRQVEKNLKKLFGPGCFRISTSRVADLPYRLMYELIDSKREKGEEKRLIPNFNKTVMHLATGGLCALSGMPDADIAIATIGGDWSSRSRGELDGHFISNSLLI